MAVRVNRGINDLATTHPVLAAEWHPTKNGELTPQQITAGSAKKYWWVGKCGHEWEIAPNLRSKGNGCPICRGYIVLIGFNDLATTHPVLAAEWHPTRNGEITPQQVIAGSPRKIWWLGKCGHEWEAALSNRRAGRSCPVCNSRKVLIGFNDLSTTSPGIATEWHPIKNGKLTAQQVTRSSNKKVWWLGKCGHEWEAVVSTRSKAIGCPICSNKLLLVGFNDLATTHPVLAVEWHPTRNGEITPQQVIAGSPRKIWWLGKCGHEWEAAMSSRSGNAKGCPICSGRLVLIGFNDLATTHPVLAAEWHPTRNQDITAKDVSAGSGRDVWWLGICGHEWIGRIGHRSNGSGCHYCANIVSKAEGSIKAYLTAMGLTVHSSNRSILSGKEIDIYIPSLKVGIEFNGVYWHSEKAGRKSIDYHHNKYLAAEQAGIQLIQIWEDDWNQKPDLVKRILAQKLGVAEEVLAVDTDVITVTKEQAKEFLAENHIQGYTEGTHYLGLVSKGDVETLRAVMVLDEESGANGETLDIVRYATSANIVEGFSKLLSHAKETFKPKSFTATVDHCEANEKLYESSGFILEKGFPPDYMYVVKNERKNRSEYPLERFHNDPKLLWEEGLREMELADLNGLDRIWDAGKTLYRLVVGK